jgi:hypothetical protein
MKSVVARSRKSLLSLALAAAFSLSACGGDEETATAAAQTPSTPGTPGTSNPPPSSPPPSSGGSTTNRAPTITGAPLGSTLYGRQYSFTPTANDADGDIVTFRISGRPSWATFDATTGRLQGTPTQANIGTSSNIVISATDGAATTSLAAFNVQVVATASGSATLSWAPPTHNSDGSPLTNLTSYRVYYGTSSGNYPNSTTINNPGLSSFVIDQLTPATWYFVITALNSTGVESAHSNVATKTVL